jgi:DNA processing protein
VTISDSNTGLAAVDDLRIAILGPQATGGPRRLTRQLLNGGRASVLAVVAKLPESDIARGAATATELSRDGIRTLLCDDPRYPDRLRRALGAPPALFYQGPIELLDRPTVGICGSRKASIEGLRSARACGEDAARFGVTVVSGYAKGVDTESHCAVLAAGGTTIAVLAEGISHLRLKEPYLSLPRSAQARMLVVSQFPPGQRWTVGAAMTRNQVIVGLSQMVIAVEPGETGGTLRAGEVAIQADRRLLMLGHAMRKAPGEDKLLAAGAHRVTSRAELEAELRRLRQGGFGGQLALV